MNTFQKLYIKLRKTIDRRESNLACANICVSRISLLGDSQIQEELGLRVNIYP